MKRLAKLGLAAFVAVFLVLCLVPSAGMLVSPTREAVGNEMLALMPTLRDTEGNWNEDYLSELSDYLADHIAFRHQLITLHSQLCAALFGTLPSEDVLLGKDGWLYYTDTLPDYQGVELLTGRQRYAAARTLALINEYCEGQGVKFLFTIAPNKNSLYPEAMPGRYQRSDQTGNAEGIAAYLDQMDVPYLDLFQVFRDQDQVLYFRTDSHWNNLGAALAGDALCTALDKDQDSYWGKSYTMTPSHQGDLYEMVYPAGSLLEEDAVFDQPFSFAYQQGFRSAEDITIRTQNPEQTGSLLMFRDSFGNALHPFMAQQYGAACFSRAMPYNLTYLDREQADTVVIELVERNLRWLVERPAILPAPVRQENPDAWALDGTVAAQGAAAESRDLEGYLEVTGTIQCPGMDEDSPVLLLGQDGKVYEASPAGEGDTPFTAFLPADAVGDSMELMVTVDGQQKACVLSLT